MIATTAAIRADAAVIVTSRAMPIKSSKPMTISLRAPAAIDSDHHDLPQTRATLLIRPVLLRGRHLDVSLPGEILHLRQTSFSSSEPDRLFANFWFNGA